MTRPEIMLKIKRLNFQVDQQAYYVCTSVTKILLTIERRLTGPQFLATDFSPTLLNTGTTGKTFQRKTFQQSGKQDSFEHYTEKIS